MMDTKDKIDKLYRGLEEPIPVFDILRKKEDLVGIRDIIKVKPRSGDFIVSVPHPGLLIPEEFKDFFDPDEDWLIEIDMFSDKLFDIGSGMHIISNLSPFFVDMNRNSRGAKEGSVPIHLRNDPLSYITVENKPLLKKSYPEEKAKAAMGYYEFYHNLLSALIEDMLDQKGYALVIDGHSMLSEGIREGIDYGRKRADFVLGTLGDSSAHPDIISGFFNSLKKGAQKNGMTIAKNIPYSGGFITRRHSDPSRNVNVVQLEVSMKSYMHEGIDDDVDKRYKLKKDRLKIVKDIISKAIDDSVKIANKVYG